MHVESCVIAALASSSSSPNSSYNQTGGTQQEEEAGQTDSNEENHLKSLRHHVSGLPYHDLYVLVEVHMLHCMYVWSVYMLHEL